MALLDTAENDLCGVSGRYGRRLCLFRGINTAASAAARDARARAGVVGDEGESRGAALKRLRVGEDRGSRAIAGAAASRRARPACERNRVAQLSAAENSAILAC